ncbi:MAG TPA: DoxX family protein [Gemmatimonadales bacterium]|nr:DoxX family protein [Gemmatimonadales bacterium]
MAARLLATDDSRALLLLRVTLALVLLPHAAQKLFGWFGGAGIQGTLTGFEQYLGIPVALGIVAIATEALAPIALLLGLGTRVAAVALAGQMAVAGWTHRANGFFANWSGTQAGEGIEFHLLYIGAALALAIGGGGAGSLDRKLAARASGDLDLPLQSLRRAA